MCVFTVKIQHVRHSSYLLPALRLIACANHHFSGENDDIWLVAGDAWRGSTSSLVLFFCYLFVLRFVGVLLTPTKGCSSPSFGGKRRCSPQSRVPLGRGYPSAHGGGQGELLRRFLPLGVPRAAVIVRGFAPGVPSAPAGPKAVSVQRRGVGSRLRASVLQHYMQLFTVVLLQKVSLRTVSKCTFINKILWRQTEPNKGQTRLCLYYTSC